MTHFRAVWPYRIWLRCTCGWKGKRTRNAAMKPCPHCGSTDLEVVSANVGKTPA
jgi:Zn finger protein HypA/HybF involved in hydrogenase expression